MLKKSVLLIVALLAVGVMITPLVQAQDMNRVNELSKQIQQLVQDNIAGKISDAEMQRRVAILQDEIMAAMQAKQQEMSGIVQEAEQRQTQANQAEAERRQTADTGRTMTSAQVTRMTAIREQLKRLETQVYEKRITEAEYNRQAGPLVQEAEKIMEPIGISTAAMNQNKEIENSINRRWPGRYIGWPSFAEFPEKFRLPTTWRQPTGTVASYTPDISSFDVYMTNATEATLNDMKQQIEKATGLKMPEGSYADFHGVTLPGRDEGNKYYPRIDVQLRLNGNTLWFKVATAH